MSPVHGLDKSSAVVLETPSQSWEPSQSVPESMAKLLMKNVSEPENGSADVASSSEPRDSNKWLQLNHVSSSVQEPMSGAKKLRKMLFETKELIVCPGVYDGLSARTAIELGFDAMYMVRPAPTSHQPYCCPPD